MSGYAETLTAWAQHLRVGGQLSWTEFVATQGDIPHDNHDHRHHEDLPTASQLRLLQLLPRADHREQLADLIFATPAPGRGLVDIPLTWPSESPFGTPAHDPEDVPAAELLRQAVGVLAAILDQQPIPTPQAEKPTPLPLPWRQRFRVHGAPVAADVVRRDLIRQRHHDTDLRTLHLVLGTPLDVMMAEHWDRRVRAGGIVRWHSLWQQWLKRDRLPRPLDLAARAQELAARGEDLVIVIGSDTEIAHTRAVTHLGRRPQIPAPPLNPAASDAFRRLNRLLIQTQGADALELWRPRLEKLLWFPDREPLGVPTDALEWAREQAERQVQLLREGGYAVVGDLTELAPDSRPEMPRRVRAGRTLPVVLAAIDQAWKEQSWPNE